MNYMLLMYLPEEPGAGIDVSDDVVLSCAIPVADRTAASGHFVSAGVLRPTSSATSVRLREGQRLVTDGPFAETREQLAGYLLVNAKNLDEAISIASEHPAALNGTVEIRPILMVNPSVPSAE